MAQIDNIEQSFVAMNETLRSEERRVGKECKSRGAAYRENKKK